MILVQDLFEHLSDFFWEVSEMIRKDTLTWALMLAGFFGKSVC